MDGSRVKERVLRWFFIVWYCLVNSGKDSCGPAIVALVIAQGWLSELGVILGLSWLSTDRPHWELVKQHFLNFFDVYFNLVVSYCSSLFSYYSSPSNLDRPLSKIREFYPGTLPS